LQGQSHRLRFGAHLLQGCIYSDKTYRPTKEPALKITYKIDPAHSSAHFTVRHMMISNVRGSFGNIQGTIEYDSANPEESTVNAVIDVNSIRTQDEKRDGHLKSPDFFDVAKYPTMTFQSREVAHTSDGAGEITGDLTIHGVTQEVTLKVEGPTAETTDPYGNVRVGASASTKIKRNDFGVKFNAPLETGGVLVGEEVKIELEISAIRS
jgi:polyisoprenoid-binding protein YceI